MLSQFFTDAEINNKNSIKSNAVIYRGVEMSPHKSNTKQEAFFVEKGTFCTWEFLHPEFEREYFKETITKGTHMEYLAAEIEMLMHGNFVTPIS